MTNTATDIWKERAQECYNVCESFLYFVLNFAWIEDKAGGEAIPFKLWDSQIRILPQFLTALRLTILKARQLGLTWMCAAYALWCCITKPLFMVVVISAKEDWAIEFLDRVKFIKDRLPEWLYPPVKKETGQIIQFLHTDNRISEIKSLATTPEGAQSKTPNLLILDETARNRYIRQIWAASKPGIDAAKGQIIIISNSIKDGVGWGWTRDVYIKSMKGINDFVRIFMPWWDRPDRPKDFRARQINEGMDEEDFSQHYPETEAEAISAMLGSFFGKSLARHNQPLDGIVGIIKRNRLKELEFVPQARGIIELWRYPYYLEEGFNDIPYTSRFCIGSDVSEGLGQTYSVAYVYDRLIQEFVARIRSNRVDAHTWAKMLWDLSRYYWNAVPSNPWYTTQPALICVETTGAGQTTVDQLKNKLGANMYVELAAGKVGSEVTKRFGWHETNQKKHDLSEDLRNWFKTTQGRVHCPILIEECSTWIKHENKTIGPEDSTKLGDCVIAAGVTLQADKFMEGTPKQIPHPVEGWRARKQTGAGRLVL